MLLLVVYVRTKGQRVHFPSLLKTRQSPFPDTIRTSASCNHSLLTHVGTEGAFGRHRGYGFHHTVMTLPQKLHAKLLPKCLAVIRFLRSATGTEESDPNSQRGRTEPF